MATAATYDWSKFVKRIPVKADMKTLYDAWSTRDGLEKWFLRKAEFKKPDGSLREHGDSIQKGDKYEWMWHGYPDSTAEHGDVLEANGKDLFRFVFGEAGTVTVKLSEAEGMIVVELTQENIPTDEQRKVQYHLGCMEGWTFYLANLKSMFEGGIDLRNRNEKLQGVVNS